MTKAAMVRALRRVINRLMAEEAESELYDPCPEFSRGLENRSSKHIASVLRRLGLDRGTALEALSCHVQREAPYAGNDPPLAYFQVLMLED